MLYNRYYTACNQNLILVIRVFSKIKIYIYIYNRLYYNIFTLNLWASSIFFYYKINNFRSSFSFSVVTTNFLMV